VPWYAKQRDLPQPPYADTRLYGSLEELHNEYAEAIREADAAIVGSYVPDGVEVGTWVMEKARGPVAFYDIDTPVTLQKLARGDWEYLHPAQIPGYDLYLSFSSGPALTTLEREYGARAARPLFCSVDPDLYHPGTSAQPYLLSYLGTYCPTRQPGLRTHLLEVAAERPRSSFMVAGPGFPEVDGWPRNVSWKEHVPPGEHAAFYNDSAFSLNLTRAEMARLGWSPSVRLFEAACCGAVVISDVWPGIETFLEPGRELLLSSTTAQTLQHLELSAAERREIGRTARRRIVAEHSCSERAAQLERYLLEATSAKKGRPQAPPGKACEIAI
jgi:spore maturation protein CgeB